MTVRYTLTITESLYERLTKEIFAVVGQEGAAYLPCGISSTDEEIRLLARDVIPVKANHYLVRETDCLSIVSDSYVPVAKRAKLNDEAIIFVHSHPEEFPDFSLQDDKEDAKIVSFFKSRAAQTPHGTMVFNSSESPRARVWEGEEWKPVERIRIVGREFRFVDRVQGKEPIPTFFDRQVRAFGPDIQRLLKQLHVGVVGAGGTGSATVEQLVRLGVGTISIFDGDTLDDSNVTRIHGSGVGDRTKAKTEIQVEYATRIGLGTKIIPYPKPITDEATAKNLRNCDIIFGCTDKQAPRGTLVRLALYYLIPVFDMAAKIHAEDEVIRGIWGRVTTLLPGEACLFCRSRIDPSVIRAESLPLDQRDHELEEGYITGLATEEPAVIMFTTAVAAQAVSEMLHRVTGFMGKERCSTEVLMFFHESRVRTNHESPKPDCLCQQTEKWGRGDRRNFLDLCW
jgi:molybdopterin/thiamine biosynthesis adenylyltransferase